ncbi:MAG: hypothetical protein JXR64_10980 [Spirochaetales bacterium]|nr:hypothetical protein [Spirochaetales bacterium]
MYHLTDEDFNYISKEVYSYANINLTEKKKSLVLSRLSKRIRKLEIPTISEYIELLKRDNYGEEFQTMIDIISTNYTLFFRESHHFDFLREEILPNNQNSLNIWSAASSTGQEIYSILMTIKEYELGNNKKLNYSLFASDISRNVLKTASTGVYDINEIENIPTPIRNKYFLKGNNEKEGLVLIKPELIQKIKFFRLNLSDNTYNLPLMDVIFLRNVIIYFDSETKINLVNKLHKYIKPGGYLILGHSETLAGISDMFSLVGKTIYKRI